jgi:hypothetical protein
MKYRKLPVEIEAVEWKGHNTVEIAHFMNVSLDEVRVAPFVNKLKIQTLEGEMTASVGDFIIRGVEGEYYPCKPDIFAKTYEPV